MNSAIFMASSQYCRCAKTQKTKRCRFRCRTEQNAGGPRPTIEVLRHLIQSQCMATNAKQNARGRIWIRVDRTKIVRSAIHLKDRRIVVAACAKDRDREECGLIQTKGYRYMSVGISAQGPGRYVRR